MGKISIDDLAAVHNNKYTYCADTHVTTKDKITIFCPIHGEFTQLVHNHKAGKGCVQCGREALSASRQAKRPSYDEYIAMCKDVHGDTYEYAYVGEVDKEHGYKIGVTCKVHGLFQQNVYNHLAGAGCKRCNSRSNKEDRLKYEKQFIEKATAIHNNKYDYSSVVYTAAKDKVIIRCPNHGEFEQTPDAHLAGKGCSSCNAEHYAYTDTPTMLYYLRVQEKDIVAYKIGITSKDVEQRYTKTELDKITILKTWMFETGKTAYEEEQRIIRKYKEYKYTGDFLLLTGNSELFTKDILELDNEQ